MKRTVFVRLFFFMLFPVMVFSIVSCMSLKPFGNKPFIYSIDREGCIVFSSSDKRILTAFTGIEKLKFSRISCCIDLTDNTVSGAVEGSFGKFPVETALSLSKNFEKVKGQKSTYFRHKQNKMEILVPAGGIVLFSSASIEDFTQKLYGNINSFHYNPLADRVLDYETAFYIKSPTKLPDLGYDLGNPAPENFNSVFFFAASDKYTLEFNLKDEGNAGKFFTLLKSAYVTGLKSRGSKINVSDLREMITIDGFTVCLKNQEYSVDLFKNTVQGIPGLL